MVALTLSLFGYFQVHLHSQPLPHFDSDKVRALLVYLAMESDRAHRRETLAGLLWPDRSDQAALTILRQFETCRRLAEELAVEPPQETLRLYERIKAGEGLQPERWKVPPRPAPDHPSVPFVAREQELALLNRHLDSALAGD